MNHRAEYKEALRNTYQAYVIWAWVFGILAMAALGLLMGPGPIPRPLLGILAGAFAVLCFVFWAVSGPVKEDLADGLVSEHCYVKSVRRIRVECLSVKTEHGVIDLMNRTGWPGEDLVKRWVVLTYARHSGYATHVQILDNPEEGA